MAVPVALGSGGTAATIFSLGFRAVVSASAGEKSMARR